MGIAERKERELQRREDEILTVALRLFDQDDWLAVTMDQIAHEAEIGKGTLYLHFASKEEIYARLSLDFGRRLLAAFRAVSPRLGPEQRLRAVVRLFLEQHLADREYRRVVEYCYREDFRRRAGEAVTAQFAELDAAFFELVDAILQEGIALGLFPRRPVTQLLIGPHSTLIGAARLLWGGCAVFPPIEPVAFIREVEEFVIAGLRARAAKPARRPAGAATAKRRLRASGAALLWAALSWSGLAPAAVARELTLGEALRLAGATSEVVAIAESEVARSEGLLRQIESGRRPQLGAASRYTRTLASQFDDIDFGDFGGDETGELPFGQVNQYDLGLAASQTIYAGGRIAAAIDQGRAGLDGARIGVLSARAEIALAVTQVFYDAVLAERLVAIAGSTLEQAERALALTESAYQVGDTAEFEVLRARIARDLQRPALLARESDRELSLVRLRQLLELPADERVELVTEREQAVAAPTACEREGRAPAETSEFAAPPGGASTSPVASAEDSASPSNGPTVCGDSPEQAALRAAVGSAETLVRAREAALAAARAERLPRVGLNSDYGRVAYPPSGLPSWDETRTNWTVALGLIVPLWTGGRLAGERAVAEADLSAARAQLQLVREAALLDARDASLRLRSAAAVWESGAGTVEQARRAYEIAEVRHREGISTQLELNDARLLLQLAEAERAVAERNLRVARARVALLADLPLLASAAAATDLTFFRSGGR